MTVGGTKHRRSWIVGGILAASVVVIVGCSVGVRAWLTAEPRQVGVEESVDSFREDANQVTTVDGVYVYDTAGSENIDVLGGDAHTYPSPTALTVVTEGCGVRMTWKPLAGRSERWLVCPLDGGSVTPRTNSVHSFFRQTYDTAFVCDSATWWSPPEGMSTWTSSCGNDDRTSTRSGRIIGIEPYAIDGETRDAIHAEWLDRLSRGSDGTVTTEIWIDEQSGLLLRQHVTTDSRNDSVVGKVTFREQLDLKLRSLVPQR